jgi:redox-sensitive bicupin YhaK (pirin superfamily)
MHRDSIGSRQRIEPGAVNLMTAGRGITHSERSPPDERADGAHLNGIQTWLAMPKATEEVAPAFEHTAEADLPLIDVDGVEVRLIMGEAWGSSSPVTCHSPTVYAAIVMPPGSSLQLQSEATNARFTRSTGMCPWTESPLIRSISSFSPPGTGPS